MVSAIQKQYVNKIQFVKNTILTYGIDNPNQ